MYMLTVSKASVITFRVGVGSCKFLIQKIIRPRQWDQDDGPSIHFGRAAQADFTWFASEGAVTSLKRGRCLIRGPRRKAEAGFRGCGLAVRRCKGTRRGTGQPRASQLASQPAASQQPASEPASQRASQPSQPAASPSPSQLSHQLSHQL